MRKSVLIALMLLSALTFETYGQALPPSPPISKQDWMASNVDLAIVKAQLSAYRQALTQALQARDVLQRTLDQFSTDSAQQSQAQREELTRLTQRLTDLNATISALETSSASVLAHQQDLLDKAEADHKAQISSMGIRLRIWRAAALVAAGASGAAVLGKGDLATTGIGAGAGLALDLVLEAFGL